MNNLIQLKGKLNERKSTGAPGRPTFSKDQKTTVNKLYDLKCDLEKLYDIWLEDTKLNGALVSVFYDRTVPKSKRIKTL